MSRIGACSDCAQCAQRLELCPALAPAATVRSVRSALNYVPHLYMVFPGPVRANRWSFADARRTWAESKIGYAYSRLGASNPWQGRFGWVAERNFSCFIGSSHGVVPP